MSERIYLSPPDVSAVERELLLEAFDSNWVAPVGPALTQFEEDVTRFTCVPHAVALSSGTADLHLALLLADVGPEDTVLTATLTFAATVNAIRYVGAQPVFIDASATTWTLDPDLLEEELERREKAGQLPKAVIAVDLYGQCADYGRIVPMCEKYGVTLIEDAAEALGATVGERCAGSFGKAAVFSFNGNKIMTTGGGGMLVSHDESWVERARYFSTQARQPVPHYEHTDVGFNYRMSNLLAAVGRGQLQRLPGLVDKRREHNRYYRERLAHLEGVTFMPEAAYGRCTFWLTCLTLDPDVTAKDREAVRLHLEAQDIEARPVWKPMHLQPVFRDAPVVGGEVADRLFERGLCLPSGSSLTEAQRERVADLVVEALSGR